MESLNIHWASVSFLNFFFFFRQSSIHMQMKKIQREPTCPSFLQWYHHLKGQAQCYNQDTDDEMVRIHSRSIATRTFPVALFMATPTFLPSPLSTWSLATTNLFSFSIILWIQECYANKTMRYVTFRDWLFSLSVVLWRLVQVVACAKGLFFVIAG